MLLCMIIWELTSNRSGTSWSAICQTSIAHDAVLILPLIVAELIQGARSKSEIRQLKELLTVFPVLQESEQAWPQAGELAFQLKQSSVHPGLADCFIAALCIYHSVPLLTLDKHFQHIKAKTSLRIYAELK